MSDNFHFNKLKVNILKLKSELPVILANQAQTYFTQTFTKQGWDGTSWKEVNRRKEGTNEYKYPKFKGLSRRTSPILVRTGTLRRAVSNSIRSASFQSIKLVVDLPYAAAQNDGVPEHNLPRRHFMGNSHLLREQQVLKIKNYMNKLWQA